jgi:hypothetical protein
MPIWGTKNEEKSSRNIGNASFYMPEVNSYYDFSSGKENKLLNIYKKINM